MSKNLPVWLGWTMFVVADAGLRRGDVPRLATRRARGLVTTSTSVWLAKIVTMAVLLGICTYYLNMSAAGTRRSARSRACPIVIPVVLASCRAVHPAAQPHASSAGTSTRSAATPRRPAGPASTCPGSSCSASSCARPSRRSAGVLLASRVNSVTPTTGGGETLLYAVGAAVIGGTSLFGGKGRPVDADHRRPGRRGRGQRHGAAQQVGCRRLHGHRRVLLLAAGVDALVPATRRGLRAGLAAAHDGPGTGRARGEVRGRPPGKPVHAAPLRPRARADRRAAQLTDRAGAEPQHHRRPHRRAGGAPGCCARRPAGRRATVVRRAAAAGRRTSCCPSRSGCRCWPPTSGSRT